MGTEDLLVSLGEVAAAFAGFSGVVGALGARSVSDLSVFTRFRFANMLITSVGAALFAFLPVVLAQFPMIAPAAWVGSSVALGSFSGLFFLLRLRAGRRAGSMDPGAVRRLFAVIWMIVLLLVLVTQVLGLTLGSGPDGLVQPAYALGVFGLLALSGLQFITLALPRTPAE
jgi:hypothetical protein